MISIENLNNLTYEINKDDTIEYRKKFLIRIKKYNIIEYYNIDNNWCKEIFFNNLDIVEKIQTVRFIKKNILFVKSNLKSFLIIIFNKDNFKVFNLDIAVNLFLFNRKCFIIKNNILYLIKNDNDIMNLESINLVEIKKFNNIIYSENINNFLIVFESNMVYKYKIKIENKKLQLIKILESNYDFKFENISFYNSNICYEKNLNNIKIFHILENKIITKCIENKNISEFQIYKFWIIIYTEDNHLEIYNLKTFSLIFKKKINNIIKLKSNIIFIKNSNYLELNKIVINNNFLKNCSIDIGNINDYFYNLTIYKNNLLFFRLMKNLNKNKKYKDIDFNIIKKMRKITPKIININLNSSKFGKDPNSDKLITWKLSDKDLINLDFSNIIKYQEYYKKYIYYKKNNKEKIFYIELINRLFRISRSEYFLKPRFFKINFYNYTDIVVRYSQEIIFFAYYFQSSFKLIKLYDFYQAHILELIKYECKIINKYQYN